jgi:hypothetical protein
MEKIQMVELVDNVGFSPGSQYAIVESDEFHEALAAVGKLILGWWQHAHFGQDELLTWSILLQGLDPAFFIPALALYAEQHPDWPPSGPQFSQCVKQLYQRHTEEMIRRRTKEQLAKTEARLLGETTTAALAPPKDGVSRPLSITQ